MAKATAGEEVIAVAFSGGLDSSIIVHLSKSHARTIACTAYSPGSRDSERAMVAAEALGVDILVTDLTADKVSAELEALRLPFQPTLMDRSLWCLYSLVSKSATSAGAKVILLGQMADELFGGYSKYEEALSRVGEDSARRMMVEDADGYESRGKVRDIAACGGRIEPRFPYDSAEVREVASRIPISYKIRAGTRKAVLRQAALEIGVPRELAEAPKKAAQYSSGVQKLVAGSHF